MIGVLQEEELDAVAHLQAEGLPPCPDAEEEPPGSTAYALYMLILLFFTAMLSYADKHLFAILLPAIKAEFKVSDSILGLIGGPGFILSFVLFSVPLARLADRWSRRKVLAISLAAWSLATGLCGAAVGVMSLSAARVIVGIGEAGGVPPSQSIIAQLFPVRRRATALSALGAGSGLGLIVGLAGGGAVATLWGWRAAFITLALPGIPLALLIWLTGPRRVPAAENEVRGASESLLASLRLCWSVPSLRLLALGLGVFNIFAYAAAVWLPAYFVRSHGMSVAQAGAWLGVGGSIATVFASSISGVLVDALCRRDERWQLRVPALGVMLSVPMCVTMLMLPGGASFRLLGQTVPVVAVLWIFSLFLYSFWMGPCFAAAARMVPAMHRSLALAVIVVTYNVLGGAGGPFITGLVSDALTARFGGEALRYSLLSMTALEFAGGMLIWRAASLFLRDISHPEARQ